MTTTDEVRTCPFGHRLEGLGLFCWDCGEYVDDLRRDPGPPEETGRRLVPDDSRTEREVRAAIVRLLRSLGYHVTDTEQERQTRVTEGLPDLFVMGCGRYTFAELKRPNRRGEKDGGLSERQREWHRLADESGVPCAVWYTEDDAIAWHESPLW